MDWQGIGTQVFDACLQAVSLSSVCPALCALYEAATLTPCCPLFTPQGSSALKLVMMMLSTQRCIRVRKKQLSSGQTPAEICQSENENRGRPIRIRKSHINALVLVWKPQVEDNPYEFLFDTKKQHTFPALKSWPELECSFFCASSWLPVIVSRNIHLSPKAGLVDSLGLLIVCL